MLGVCPTSRKTESVERFQRNWTKLFQVVEVWIELVLGLSEIAKRNPCFPDRRFRPVTANCLVMQAVGMLPVADLLQSLWKWQKLLPSL